MSTQAEFYRARALEARAQADAATLDNVRERCLRSESAWIVMADRADRTENAREQRERAKTDAAPALQPQSVG